MLTIQDYQNYIKGSMVWCLNEERTGWGTELYESIIEMIEETSDYFTIKFEDDKVVDDDIH